jgi:hypothetical protein
MIRTNTMVRVVLFTLYSTVLVYCAPNIAWASPGVFTNKNIYLPGESIQVTYSGAPGYRGDWICVVRSSTRDNNAGRYYQYIPYGQKRGTLYFAARSPGDYQVRAYYNYRGNGYVVSARHSFSVVRRLPPAEATGAVQSQSPEVAEDDYYDSQNSHKFDQKLKQAQYVLMERGYDPGAPDGKLGRQTRSALRAFQRENQLRQTGALNRDTLIALGLLQRIPKKETPESTNVGREETPGEKPADVSKQVGPTGEQRPAPPAMQ